MFSSTYGEAAFSEGTCREWFQRFKSGDFDAAASKTESERVFTSHCDRRQKMGPLR